MPQTCPHCGKPMIQGIITENYEAFYTCNCDSAKTKKTLRENPEPDKSIKEAERYLLEQTRKTHDRYIALGLVEEKYGTGIANQLAKKYRIKTSLDKRSPVKKNPFTGTDVWGHKLFIENPTREELQEIADALGIPIGIEKDLSKEMEIYKRFHHRKPTEIIRVEHPSTPKSLVALGKLESVIYRKCSDNQAYIHDLKHGLLCSDKKGKLWIVGDKARITRRGIVG